MRIPPADCSEVMTLLPRIELNCWTEVKWIGSHTPCHTTTTTTEIFWKLSLYFHHIFIIFHSSSSLCLTDAGGEIAFSTLWMSCNVSLFHSICSLCSYVKLVYVIQKALLVVNRRKCNCCHAVDMYGRRGGRKGTGIWNKWKLMFKLLLSSQIIQSHSSNQPGRPQQPPWSPLACALI